jgi:hypothetical protein
MKKCLLIVLFLVGWVQAVPSPVTSPNDPCTVGSALLILIPGAEYEVKNNDYATFNFIGVSTYTAPSQGQVNSQIASCEANYSQFPVYQLELSTTVTAVAAYPNLVAPTAIQQQKVARDMARIHALRNLLGLQ